MISTEIIVSTMISSQLKVIVAMLIVIGLLAVLDDFKENLIVESIKGG